MSKKIYINKIPAQTRLKVYERDGYKCKHCGTTDELTLDHIRPKSEGGTDEIVNLQTLCSDCNKRKANFEDYPFYIRFRKIWSLPEQFATMKNIVNATLSTRLAEIQKNTKETLDTYKSELFNRYPHSMGVKNANEILDLYKKQNEMEVVISDLRVEIEKLQPKPKVKKVVKKKVIKKKIHEN